jgi:hypothetical protein
MLGIDNDALLDRLCESGAGEGESPPQTLPLLNPREPPPADRRPNGPGPGKALSCVLATPKGGAKCRSEILSFVMFPTASGVPPYSCTSLLLAARNWLISRRSLALRTCLAPKGETEKIRSEGGPTLAGIERMVGGQAAARSRRAGSAGRRESLTIAS